MSADSLEDVDVYEFDSGGKYYRIQDGYLTRKEDKLKSQILVNENHQSKM